MGTGMLLALEPEEGGEGAVGCGLPLLGGRPSLVMERWEEEVLGGRVRPRPELGGWFPVGVMEWWDILWWWWIGGRACCRRKRGSSIGKRERTFWGWVGLG